MTKGQKIGESQDGYFLGGRSLTATVIAGSLMLTQLNALNFVGLTSQAYTGNMASMAWSVTTALPMIFVAIYLMPRYLKQGITTIPDFLESRFNKTTKSIVSFLFLTSYILNLLPPTLYTGALALVRIFDIKNTFGISESAAIWILVWALGLIGAGYAIFGGLKAIAVSDTINGVGLLFGGMAIPVFALAYLGDGEISVGLQKILTTHTDKLNSIGSASSKVPFATLFTGMFLVNIYFWGTDQSMIQRTLGAKSLESAQKGVMVAALLKMFTPFMLLLPGIVAFHIYQGKVFDKPDMVYSTLVSDVLPKPLAGFFAAVMFGAILSTFNSVLNSASTLFAINFVKPYSKKPKTEKELVIIGRNIGIVMAFVSMIIAPFLMYAPEGIFQYFQKVASLFSIPIFTIIIVGYMTRFVPAIAANMGIIFFVAIYALLQFVIKPELHFLHQGFILFIITTIMMLIIGKFYPRKEAFVLPSKDVVNLTPWKHRYIFGIFLTIFMIVMYIIFSPLVLTK